MPASLSSVLLGLLPLLLIGGLLYAAVRHARRQAASMGGLGGLGGAARLTKAKARVIDAERPATRFADVAGYPAVKTEIGESPRVVFPMPGLSRPQHRADCARVPAAAQRRPVGGDQAAPDTVLADIPGPQRQFQALRAHRAGGADGDRRGRLVAGLACFRTDREPLVGIEGAVSAAGVPDDPGPQGPIGDRDGRRRIRRPGSGPVRGVGGRPGIRQRRGCAKQPCAPPFPDIRCGGIPGRRRSSPALLAPWQAPGLTLAPDRPLVPVTRRAGRPPARGAVCPALARPGRSAGPPCRLRPAAWG
jgi:hypothetical protein